MRRSSVLVTLFVGLAACKGDRGKCEEICRHVFQVSYWEAADAEIAAAPPEKRESLKKHKLVEFSNKLENGVELCVNQCASANNDDLNACLLAVKNTADIKKCTAD
ncbi:MAG: hypothetical protein SFX73_39375 [Kofleriaceae bacterium]|nr:hypothetical protein [Kofleriaceae bacterium]